MTGKEAIEISGRSESWLRRHECAWCNQVLWKALLYGCAAQHEKCDPTKKNFGKTGAVTSAKPYPTENMPGEPALTSTDGGAK